MRSLASFSRNTFRLCALLLLIQHPLAIGIAQASASDLTFSRTMTGNCKALKLGDADLTEACLVVRNNLYQNRVMSYQTLIGGSRPGVISFSGSSAVSEQAYHVLHLDFVAYSFGEKDDKGRFTPKKVPVTGDCRLEYGDERKAAHLHCDAIAKKGKRFVLDFDQTGEKDVWVDPDKKLVMP